MAKYEYEYPHPALTADCVVFGYDGERLSVLLVERGNEPYKGCWAFPGGFMNIDETAEACALRELEEETGLKLTHVEQTGAYSAVDRDPRERVITVAHYALTRRTTVSGGDDAAQARWWPIESLPPLAFDHDEMFRRTLQCLRRDLGIAPTSIDSLPLNGLSAEELQHIKAAI